MVFVLGLTGGIGCGKSAATAQFAHHGIQIVDADIIAREVVAPGSAALDAIAAHFGQAIRLTDGRLDRKALRAAVFADPSKKVWLETLLHPLIRQRIQQQLEAAHPPYVVLCAPLLLETDLHRLADRIAVIDCDEHTQLERALRRDHSDADSIKRIMAQQLSRQQRLRKADDVLDNQGPIEALQSAVDHYHQQLLNKLS
ncbi:MAG: dephospho-CoA kinase [Cellvibrionaceae bacterium]|nr:dephospho-CoA kinase [Cellvibrionaceae bacterium]